MTIRPAIRCCILFDQKANSDRGNAPHDARPPVHDSASRDSGDTRRLHEVWRMELVRGLPHLIMNPNAPVLGRVGIYIAAIVDTVAAPMVNHNFVVHHLEANGIARLRLDKSRLGDQIL